MIRRGIFLICALGVLCSCKGGPPRIGGVVPEPSPPEAAPERGPGSAPVPAIMPVDEPDLAGVPAGEPDLADAPEPPVPPGGEPFGEEALTEPLIGFAESSPPETPPLEPPSDIVLPEPQEAFKESPEPAVPAVESPPPPPSAPPPVPPARETKPPVPENPPAFIRPAEPVPAPPAVREPVPVPVNPLPPLPAQAPPRVQDEEIVYSRTVRATVGQLIEIPFRGTGWVYLGELGSRRGVDYDSRRLDTEGQSFVFRAEAAGTYGLKFYKQDFIRDYILNDYVQVIIGEAPDASGAGWFNPPIDRGRVIAEPRWPAPPGERPSGGDSPGSSEPEPPPSGEAAGTGMAVPGEEPPGSSPPAEGRAGYPQSPGVSVPAAGTAERSPEQAREPPPGAGFPETAGIRPDAGPDEYIRRSREEYEAGRVAGALAILDQFRERFPSGSDEAWWLYGQLLEANSPSRDIRSALDYYRRLVREYPQSGRWDDARRRIAYLERYYFNIR